MQNPKCCAVISRDRNQLMIRCDNTVQPDK
jgi:hypothetical protein